jgi:hypothetical protein
MAVSVVLAAVLVVGGGLCLVPSNVRAVERGDIRVFLGNPDVCGPVKGLWYASSRHALLQDMAATNHLPVEACVVFGRYLTPDEAGTIIDCGQVRPLEIFLADPASYAGGGTVLHPDETVAAAFARHIQEFKAGMSDYPVAARDIERAVAGQWRLVAARVSAPAADLLALTRHCDVRLVDPFYHPEAEQKARARGGVVKYICTPIRPDGRPF